MQFRVTAALMTQASNEGRSLPGKSELEKTSCTQNRAFHKSTEMLKCPTSGVFSTIGLPSDVAVVTGADGNIVIDTSIPVAERCRSEASKFLPRCTESNLKSKLRRTLPRRLQENYKSHSGKGCDRGCHSRRERATILTDGWKEAMQFKKTRTFIEDETKANKQKKVKAKARAKKRKEGQAKATHKKRIKAA